MSDVIDGDEELIRKLQALNTKVGTGMSQAMLAGAFILEGFIKQSMQEGHHGRVYRRGGRAHQASAPGETPAIDYGSLVNSIVSELTAINESQVSTSSEVAAPLEFGTVSMAARPFFRPAVDEHHGEVAEAVRATIQRLVAEAAR